MEQNSLLARFQRGLANIFKLFQRKHRYLESHERVTRFIFERRLVVDGRPKPKAFYPEVHPRTKIQELSVCRVNGTGEARIWHVGKVCRKDKALIARADFDTRAAEDGGLQGKEAPEKNYKEHAVFIGWPDEDKEDKTLRLQIAQGIAENAIVSTPLESAVIRP